MALFRFEAKVISRGYGRSTVAAASYRSGKYANGGKSAVSAAAYRNGGKLVDERTGQTYDYTNKKGVLGSEIMTPDGAAPWTTDRQKLWAAVELIEKRRDAQLARDFILTLPHELSHEQRVALTREFVREQFCAKGLIADIAWHAPGKRGDERNFHAHVMVPMRRIEGDGFAAKKDRPTGGDHPMKAWTDELMRLRVAWAGTANKHLAAAGLDVRLDPRSLAEQGVDREPEPKIGPLAHNVIEAEGRESLAGNDNRAVKARNAELAQFKAELAAAVAEESDIIDLMTHRLRRSGMPPDPTHEFAPEQMPEEQRRRLDALRQAEERARETLVHEAQRVEASAKAFRTAADIEADEAKKKLEATAQAQERRRLDGEISSAPARYSIALGQEYDIRDPYGSLARAAMSEFAMFHKNQEAMRADIAQEKDPAKRREIELRMGIEGHDYMAITHERLAGISEATVGRANTDQARDDRGWSAYHSLEATKLRVERREFIQEREKAEREEKAGKFGDLARAVESGALVNDDRKRQAEETNPTSSARAADDKKARDVDDAAAKQVGGKREGDAEITDAKAAKLAKIRESNEGYEARAAAKKQDHERGGGGRSGR